MKEKKNAIDQWSINTSNLDIGFEPSEDMLNRTIERLILIRQWLENIE